MTARDRAVGAVGSVARVTGVRAVRRVVDRTDLVAVARDEEAVDSLEVAVAENTRLAGLLEQQVTALEDELMSLVESLEGDTRDHS